MEILLSKADIDLPKLRKKIYTIVGTEISSLSEPCYYPSLKKYYYELLHICKLKEVDIKDFVKRFYKGTPAAKWKLQRDPISNFYIFIMYVFLSKKQINSYRSTMLLYNIRQYTNLMNKQMKFCNKDVFKYALEHLAKTHLFVREKTIPNSLFFLSKEMERHYTKGIQESSVEKVILFITVCRTRISQSIKSFAELYYRSSKESLGMRQPDDDEEKNESQRQQIEKSSRVINDVVRKITVYKVIDKKAIEEAKTITKIRSSLATMISGNITDVKYADNLKSILELFVRDLKGVSYLCGDDFHAYVRSLMAVKRTKSLVYFKKQINELLLSVIKKLNYEKTYNTLTKQTQSLINLYLAFYITIVIRNTIC